jgi:predicted enzyme related to lactoylglutathione lyase
MATIPTGRFVWFEYASKEAKKAQAFFGELFQWKTTPPRDRASCAAPLASAVAGVRYSDTMLRK